MKPYKLIAKKENGSKCPPCLSVIDFKNEVMATIWADKRITPSEQQQDYEYDEIKYFMLIAENFFSFYNNIMGLQEEIETIQNPVLCRNI